MDLSAVRIEIAAAVIALGLLAFALAVPRGKRNITGALAAIAFLALLAFSFLAPGGSSFSGGRYLNDPLSLFFKQVFIAAAFLYPLCPCASPRASGNPAGTFTHSWPSPSLGC